MSAHVTCRGEGWNPKPSAPPFAVGLSPCLTAWQDIPYCKLNKELCSVSIVFCFTPRDLVLLPYQKTRTKATEGLAQDEAPMEGH